MTTKTFTSQEVNAEIPKVFKVFSGMDDEYVKLIREHHNVISSRKYSTDYIKQHQSDTVNKIGQIVEERKTKARGVIEGIRNIFKAPESNAHEDMLGILVARYGIEDSEKKKSEIDRENPYKYARMMEKAGDKEEKVHSLSPGDKLQAEIAMQLQRNNNIMLWNAHLPHATVDELRSMWELNKQDPDFMTLLLSEFRKRPKEDGNIARLKHEIENPPADKRFDELDKVEKAIAFVNGDNYAANMSAGLKDFKFRNVRSDLNAVPVGTNAPSFKLPNYNN